PEPAIYLGEYTTLVAVQGEGGEIIELEAAFTVVDGTEDEDQNGTPGDGETAPPEDDGSSAPPSDGHDEQVPPEGDGDAETPSKGEGHDEQVPAHDEAESGTPSKGEYQQAPSHDDGGSLTKDDGAHHDAEHYADHHDGDELANTGSNLTAGILSGLLVALGAGLAFFGYRHRIGRHSA
ncbi:MAG TPA: LPXTG cell wall anchor domain-containing protein, partial [Candidatus Nesterenkonia stercoripullorum]|nr:LPXTG cell wall anchor domain-containing protein [Candidatus Nesterenkonia stercoripullorum]